MEEYKNLQTTLDQIQKNQDFRNPFIPLQPCDMIIGKCTDEEKAIFTLFTKRIALSLKTKDSLKQEKCDRESNILWEMLENSIKTRLHVPNAMRIAVRTGWVIVIVDDDLLLGFSENDQDYEVHVEVFSFPYG